MLVKPIYIVGGGGRRAGRPKRGPTTGRGITEEWATKRRTGFATVVGLGTYM